MVAAMTTIGIPSHMRRLGWPGLDIAAAVVLTAIAVAEVASSSRVAPAVAIAAVVFAATVGWCRRAPTVAVCVGLVSGAAMVAIGGVDLAIAPLVTAILYFMLGRSPAAGRRLAADLVLVVVAVPLVVASPGVSGVVAVASVWLFFFAAPFAAGWWVGRGTLLALELQRNVDELAYRHRERARQVASVERARIARELHDVVAHNVSVMVVQTQAARRVVSADVVAASTALQAVSDCGRDALVDMRRMVGALHRDDLELAAPGLAQLPALVERAEASGLRVSLEVREPAVLLPAAVDLAVYRLAQEALTNVIKHARATCAWITVVRTHDAVELGVADDGCGPTADGRPADTGGHGLIGMRERLVVYGGELRVGERPGGGFQVTARLPIDGRRPT
jgi:signal transduction histidine kinase